MKTSAGQGRKGWKRIFTKKGILIIIVLAVIAIGGTGFGVLKASEKPSFCALCHNMKPYYESWNDSNLMAHQHATEDVTCHKCHEESTSKKLDELKKYVTGDYQVPMEKRDFGSRKFCLECHDFEEVKAKTDFEESNPHDSHNGEMECNECHSMHSKSKVYCAQCHTFTWMNDLDDNWDTGR